jgi:DNA-binding MarR family transcriptional regulator
VRQPHGYVLRALHERPLSLTALAELLGVTKQAVAQVVDEMVELGLVERRPDPSDGRAKLLALTRRGRAARTRALEVSAALEREIPNPAAVRAGLLAIIEAEGFGDDVAHRRARPVW